MLLIKEVTEMTTATLKAQGRLITDIHEGYTRYAMADDGRVFRETYKGSKIVWTDDENRVIYKDLFAAYFKENGKSF